MNIISYLKDFAKIWLRFALLLLPTGLLLCFIFNIYHRHSGGMADKYDLFQVAKIILIGLVPASLIMAFLMPKEPKKRDKR